jgi:dCTP deaminase
MNSPQHNGPSSTNPVLSLFPPGSRLSDTAILRRLIHPDYERRIIISPMIDPSVQLGTDSIDLRLGSEFILTEQAHFTHVDPASTQEITRQKLATRTRFIRRASIAHPFVLHPGRFALAATLEFVALPGDIAAHVEGRSSWARLGIQVHSTATNVHPWSAGVITFELQNLGGLPVELYPGMRMGQLTFVQLDTLAAKPARSHKKYHLDLQVAASRYYADEEMIRIYALKVEQEAERRRRNHRSA